MELETTREIRNRRLAGLPCRHHGGMAASDHQHEELDYAPVNGPSYQPPKIENRKELLAEFDRMSPNLAPRFPP